MKIYGHPWSINTRKVLMTLAEKGRDAELGLVMLPKGEHLQPEHVARHPFAKVPVLDDDGFVLYETRAICGYLDGKIDGPSLTPSDRREAARVEQWISVADSYFIPYAQPLIVELIFRKFLGGEQDQEVIASGREGVAKALDTADAWLADHDYFAGSSFSRADIHWMPYLEYLTRSGNGEAITQRKNLRAWWERVSSRQTWQDVARTGPQPYDAGVGAEVVQQAAAQ